MAEPTSAMPRSNYFYAALAAAMGLFFIVTGARLLPLPGGPSNLHGPHWLVLCVGLAFFSPASPSPCRRPGMPMPRRATCPPRRRIGWPSCNT